MYVFVTCNFFIITGPLLESTRIDGPDDQETLPYQQQDNDDQPTIPYSNDGQPTMPYQEDDDQQDDATLPHFDVTPQLQESSLQDPPPAYVQKEEEGLCRCLQSYEGESRRRNEGAAVHG